MVWLSVAQCRGSSARLKDLQINVIATHSSYWNTTDRKWWSLIRNDCFALWETLMYWTGSTSSDRPAVDSIRLDRLISLFYYTKYTHNYVVSCILLFKCSIIFPCCSGPLGRRLTAHFWYLAHQLGTTDFLW